MSEKFSSQEQQVLSQYVTDPVGDTFCVNIPGLAGPIFARYSRAPYGFRTTLLREFLKDGRLNVTRTQELIERILNDYGDDSVGELEGAHLALEQVSNLTTKIVEDCRLGGSPIEQSTRYVFYDTKDPEGRFKYYRGEEILASPVSRAYTETMDFVFETYAAAVAPLTAHFQRLKPLEEAEYEIRGAGVRERYAAMDSEAFQKQFRVTYKADLRTKACDVLRCILPAATLTNLGIFGNGRFFQGLLTKLYTSELPECRHRAGDAHRELNKVIPKFVKRAKRDEAQAARSENMRRLSEQLLSGVEPDPQPDCSLFPPAANEKDLLDRVLAACLYPHARQPFLQLLSLVRGLSPEMRHRILETYAGNRRDRRDRPGRAMETGYPLTFDLQADFGAYRDLQRHRVLTQERQLLHPGLGFQMPEELHEAGWDQRVKECCDRSAGLHAAMAAELGPEIAQYAVLFGYKIRWMIGMNFREAAHLLELRTTPQGHPGYRKLAQQMMDAIRAQHPELAATIRFVDYNDYYWSRAESEARIRRKERDHRAAKD